MTGPKTTATPRRRQAGDTGAGRKPRAYICSPLGSGDREELLENMHRARAYMRRASEELGVHARAPHAYLPMLLCDQEPKERAIALRFGMELMEAGDMVLVCGDRISRGMKEEILHAASMRMPILAFAQGTLDRIQETLAEAGYGRGMASLEEGHPFLAGAGKTERSRG